MGFEWQIRGPNALQVPSSFENSGIQSSDGSPSTDCTFRDRTLKPLDISGINYVKQ
jgi:hypothetical protein